MSDFVEFMTCCAGGATILVWIGIGVRYLGKMLSKPEPINKIIERLNKK